MSYQVPVVTVNVPHRIEFILLPDLVTIQFRCPFEEAAGIKEEDFVLVVDYNRFITNAGGKTIPEVQQAPGIISHVQLTPPFIDGIIQNRY